MVDKYVFFQIIPLNKPPQYQVHKVGEKNFWEENTIHLANLDFRLIDAMSFFTKKEWFLFFSLEKYEIITYRIDKDHFTLKRYNCEQGEKEKLFEFLNDLTEWQKECETLYLISWNTFIWEKPFLEQRIVINDINYYDMGFPEKVRFIDFKNILTFYRSCFNGFQDWFSLFTTGDYGSTLEKIYERKYEYLPDLAKMVKVFKEGINLKINISKRDGYENRMFDWFICETNNRFEDQYLEWRWNYNNKLKQIFFSVINSKMDDLLTYNIETCKKYSIEGWGGDMYEIKSLFKIDFNKDWLDEFIFKVIDKIEYQPPLYVLPIEKAENKREIDKIKKNLDEKSFFIYNCFQYSGIPIDLYKYIFNSV